MAYRRVIAPPKLSQGDDLTRDMAGIGMRFASDASSEPNIEDTLLAASVEGMARDDLRVISVLVTWMQIHYPWINADRLTRIVSNEKSLRVKAFFAATATRLKKDRRFARMAKLYSEPQIDILRVSANFQIERKGEDHRFENTVLRVPSGVLRFRQSDVLAPCELARVHSTYRQRIFMGPTYRADMWAALENEPTMTAAKLARQTYGSFATAWQVKKDFKILAA